MLGGIYTIMRRGLLQDLVRKHIFDYSIYANGELQSFSTFELRFAGISHFPSPRPLSYHHDLLALRGGSLSNIPH